MQKYLVFADFFNVVCLLFLQLFLYLMECFKYLI